jgi:arsenate reductase
MRDDPRQTRPFGMTGRPYKVLFLCTGNSARSIMAESILRKEGRGRFEAYSAGSRPKTRVNALALKALEHLGFPLEGLRSKSWEELAAPGSPKMDFVFTVCDNAAGESCPVWPGQPMTAHWGIEDPAAVAGTDLEKYAALLQALRFLKTRISLFLALPIASLDKMALQSSLVAIGREAGASARAQRED